LLDTGSEASLLPASIVDPASIIRTTQTLKAANGTIIPVLGKVTMKMKIGEIETRVSGLVSEHIIEVMLGIDWLTTNGVVWDFDGSRISVGGRICRLYARSGDSKWCRRVALQADTVVPPRSEMNVLVRVVCRPWRELTGSVQWGYGTNYSSLRCPCLADPGTV